MLIQLLSFPNNFLYLKTFFQKIPPMILLSETLLTPQNKASFCNYISIRNYKSPSTRNNLKFNPSFEYTAIKVSFNSFNLYIYSVYFHSTSLISSELTNLLFSHPSPDAVIVFWDFNARHISSNYPNSIELRQTLFLFKTTPDIHMILIQLLTF